MIRFALIVFFWPRPLCTGYCEIFELPCELGAANHEFSWGDPVSNSVFLAFSVLNPRGHMYRHTEIRCAKTLTCKDLKTTDQWLASFFGDQKMFWSRPLWSPVLLTTPLTEAMPHANILVRAFEYDENERTAFIFVLDLFF